MVKNISYRVSEIPHEWWSICEYTDICFFAKFSNVFYDVCLNGECSFKNYRKLSDLEESKKNLVVGNLAKRIFGI